MTSKIISIGSLGLKNLYVLSSSSMAFSFSPTMRTFCFILSNTNRRDLLIPTRYTLAVFGNAGHPPVIVSSLYSGVAKFGASGKTNFGNFPYLTVGGGGGGGLMDK